MDATLTPFSLPQKAILEFLQEYADEMYGKDPSSLETQLVADKENHQYLLFRYGWDEGRFIHSCRLHFSIKADGKVWVWQNQTEEMVGDELVKRGVQVKDIILAFHPPEVRVHTGFGSDTQSL